MSLPANHADGPTTEEVVHVAGWPHSQGVRQLCARCGDVLVDKGRTYPPGESVVAYEGTSWRSTRPPTCHVPPLRAHDVKGGR